jgi:hypothetical protein
VGPAQLAQNRSPRLGNDAADSHVSVDLAVLQFLESGGVAHAENTQAAGRRVRVVSPFKNRSDVGLDLIDLAFIEERAKNPSPSLDQ